MNKAILIGRITKDPDIRYSQGAEPMCIARYTLAVDRRGTRKEGQQNADFISCIAFRKSAEFAEKYLRKGMKIAVAGHIQTGSHEKDAVEIGFFGQEINITTYNLCRINHKVGRLYKFRVSEVDEWIESGESADADKQIGLEEDQNG